MYISCSNNGGKPYLNLLHSFVEKNNKGVLVQKKKFICSIGPLHKFDDGQPDYLKRLRKSFKNGNPLIPSLKKYCEGSPIRTFNFTVTEGSDICIGKTELFSHILIERILEKLGLIQLFRTYKSNSKLEFDVLGFFRLLVYGRILDPSSKIATVNKKDVYYNEVLKSDYKYNVYDTLDFIYRFRSSIINKLNKSLINHFKRDTSLIYYDVTNFYFETEKADDDLIKDDQAIKGLRQFGVSKEERSLPIVQMGLFMDNNGLPISIETFPGNTLDHLTMLKATSKTVDNLGLSRYIFVGDRGICSYKNLFHLLDHNNGYIVSKSIAKSKSNIKKWIEKQDDYIKVSDDFKYKSKIVTRIAKDENNIEREITEKVVVYWSRKFAQRELKTQRSFLTFLKKLREHPRTFRLTKTQYKSIRPFLRSEVKVGKTGEIINSSDIKFLIDEDKINNMISHMGYYQIVSSEVYKSEEEIIDIYHGLSRIEDQFRIMKGTLETRPLFVRNSEHIYSHLLICMIALTIVRIIQNKIVDYKNEDNINYWKMGLSGDKIRAALNKWVVAIYTQNYYRMYNIEDNSDLKLILDAFDINIPKTLFTKQELRELKKEIKI